MPPPVKLRGVKVVLLGDAGVGKSSLATMFVTQKFTPRIEAPSGLTSSASRGAVAAIVMYDITSQRSFRAVTYWVNELQTRGPQGIVIALAGNKCNHESNREVKKEEAERFEEEIGALFFETSAKDGDGVMDIFLSICKKLPVKKVVQQVGTAGLDKLGLKNNHSSCC